MSTVRDILSRKGSQVMSISSAGTTLDAALLMNEHRIGALIVIDAGEVQGIFTERDMLQRVVAARRDPAATLVQDVMTRNIVLCGPDTSIEDARNIFMTKRVRHLPVLDDLGNLHGVVSIGDINAWDLQGKDVTIRYLREYLYGGIV